MTRAGSEDERRRFSRVIFRRPATLEAEGERVTCELLDVSLKGALAEATGLRAGPGTRCTLSVRLDAGDARIRMDGEIVHREGTLVGVRCTEIDLDSISHLRRLVELNLGDDAALHRELSALVAGR